jgi:hypothetical protein
MLLPDCFNAGKPTTTTWALLVFNLRLVLGHIDTWPILVVARSAGSLLTATKPGVSCIDKLAPLGLLCH